MWIVYAVAVLVLVVGSGYLGYRYGRGVEAKGREIVGEIKERL